MMSETIAFGYLILGVTLSLVAGFILGVLAHRLYGPFVRCLGRHFSFFRQPNSGTPAPTFSAPLHGSIGQTSSAATICGASPLSGRGDLSLAETSSMEMSASPLSTLTADSGSLRRKTLSQRKSNGSAASPPVTSTPLCVPHREVPPPRMSADDKHVRAMRSTLHQRLMMAESNDTIGQHSPLTATMSNSSGVTYLTQETPLDSSQLAGRCSEPSAALEDANGRLLLRYMSSNLSSTTGSGSAGNGNSNSSDSPRSMPTSSLTNSNGSVSHTRQKSFPSLSLDENGHGNHNSSAAAVDGSCRRSPLPTVPTLLATQCSTPPARSANAPTQPSKLSVSNNAPATLILPPTGRRSQQTCRSSDSYFPAVSAASKEASRTTASTKRHSSPCSIGNREMEPLPETDGGRAEKSSEVFPNITLKLTAPTPAGQRRSIKHFDCPDNQNEQGESTCDPSRDRTLKDYSSWQQDHANLKSPRVAQYLSRYLEQEDNAMVANPTYFRPDLPASAPPVSFTSDKPSCNILETLAKRKDSEPHHLRAPMSAPVCSALFSFLDPPAKPGTGPTLSSLSTGRRTLCSRCGHFRRLVCRCSGVQTTSESSSATYDQVRLSSSSSKGCGSRPASNKLLSMSTSRYCMPTSPPYIHTSPLSSCSNSVDNGLPRGRNSSLRQHSRPLPSRRRSSPPLGPGASCSQLRRRAFLKRPLKVFASACHQQRLYEVVPRRRSSSQRGRVASPQHRRVSRQPAHHPATLSLGSISSQVFTPTPSSNSPGKSALTQLPLHEYERVEGCVASLSAEKDNPALNGPDNGASTTTANPNYKTMFQGSERRFEFPPLSIARRLSSLPLPPSANAERETSAKSLETHPQTESLPGRRFEFPSASHSRRLSPRSVPSSVIDEEETCVFAGLPTPAPKTSESMPERSRPKFEFPPPAMSSGHTPAMSSQPLLLSVDRISPVLPTMPGSRCHSADSSHETVVRSDSGGNGKRFVIASTSSPQHTFTPSGLPTCENSSLAELSRGEQLRQDRGRLPANSDLETSVTGPHFTQAPDSR